MSCSHRLSSTRFALISTLALTIALAAPAAALAAQSPAVQLHLLWGSASAAEKDRQLDQAKRAGARVVRIDVGWQTLEEARKGKYSSWYLSQIDDVVNKARARGLKVLFTLVFTPCWASSAPDSIKQGCSAGWYERGVGRYPPSNPRDYADALRFLASRYRGRVTAWEIWNEPNLKAFWNTSRPVARYVALLKAAYRAAKAADPGAVVVGGALSESDVTFTNALYRAGAKGNFDALSIHPYSHDYSPLRTLDPRWVKSSFIQGVPAVRNVMRRYGDARRMWLTEFGWSTSSIRGRQNPWENGVSESTQATYLRQAFTHMHEWSYVDVGVWYNLVNRSADTADRESNFGLLRHDRTKKPAYSAFQKAAAR